MVEIGGFGRAMQTLRISVKSAILTDKRLQSTPGYEERMLYTLICMVLNEFNP